MSRVRIVAWSWEIAEMRDTRSYFSELRAVMVKCSSKSWVSPELDAIFVKGCVLGRL